METNELFIGRTEYLNRFMTDYFSESRHHCCSLVGLNGIGKTTLIRQLSEKLIERKPENTFYFDTTIENGITFWSYWTYLIKRLSEEITEEYLKSLCPEPMPIQERALSRIPETYELAANALETGEIETSVTYHQNLIIALNDLFKYYTDLGVHIILTIDEFDRAQTCFTNGQFFQRLFSLSPKGGARLNLSIVTISRRKVYTIAHDMQEGSNFEDAYPSMILKGFSDTELAEYFDTYKGLPCGPLTDDVKKQILYLCGRSPGLLMAFRHEIGFLNGPCTDVGALYAEHGQFIKTAYSRMVTLMESTFADKENQKPLLDVYIQKFIGPAYDDNFEVELSLLFDYGFVTKGTVESNIFTMSGVAHLDAGDAGKDEDVYEPIAPYFIEYLKLMIIPNDLKNLSNLLIKAERLIREVIEKEMRLAFPETWEEIINKYAGQKAAYLETLQQQVLKNDYNASSITKLNVISFNEYYMIVKDHWGIFSKYFRSYQSKELLKNAMSMLNQSRNDSAHLNLVVYNGDNRRKLRETCALFIASLENDPSAAPAPPTRAPKMGTLPDEAQIAALVENHQVVTFRCQEVKKPKKNLRGFIKEYGFPAGVSKKQLDAFGFASPRSPGDEFRAAVEQWDAQSQIFNLRVPDKA